jgi:hypothetical protein
VEIVIPKIKNRGPGKLSRYPPQGFLELKEKNAIF